MNEDQMDIDTCMFSLDPDSNRHTNSLVPEVEQPEPEHKPKQRFEVKKWTAVAFWSWGMYTALAAVPALVLVLLPLE